MKTWILGFMALSLCTALSHAQDPVTYTPLADDTKWTKQQVTVNLNNQADFRSATKWNTPYGTWSFESPLSLATVGDKIEVSYNINNMPASPHNAQAAVCLTTDGGTAGLMTGWLMYQLSTGIEAATKSSGWPQGGSNLTANKTTLQEMNIPVQWTNNSCSVTFSLTCTATDTWQLSLQADDTEPPHTVTLTASEGVNFNQIDGLLLACAAEANSSPIINELLVTYTPALNHAPEPCVTVMTLAGILGMCIRRKR